MGPCLLAFWRIRLGAGSVNWRSYASFVYGLMLHGYRILRNTLKEMNKYLILLSLFLSACVSTQKRSSNIPNKPHIEIVEFQEVDINQDGNITEEEFQQAKNTIKGSNETNYQAPAMTFVGIMLVVGLLIFLSSILNKKNRKNNVGS